MLGGAVPFKRDSAWSVLYAHLNEVPPLITVPWGLPPAVHEALATALAKAPGDRYASCAEFADALREALALDPYDPTRAARPTPTMPVTMISPGPDPVTVVQPDRSLPPDGPRPPAGTGGRSGRSGLSAFGGAATQAVTWLAVVTADRAYYNTVDAIDEQADEPISFPEGLPERRIPLAGGEVRIGRRSSRLPYEPEIDLYGPPRDPGVSRQHAKLVPAPDGTWCVVDLGTDNGIAVNGRDVRSGDTVPLRPGDQIHLGAWTRITITHG
jgi:hypothetical protein